MWKCFVYVCIQISKFRPQFCVVVMNRITCLKILYVIFGVLSKLSLFPFIHSCVILSFNFIFLYHGGGKSVHGFPDGKWLPWPMYSHTDKKQLGICTKNILASKLEIWFVSFLHHYKAFFRVFRHLKIGHKANWPYRLKHRNIKNIIIILKSFKFLMAKAAGEVLVYK